MCFSDTHERYSQIGHCATPSNFIHLNIFDQHHSPEAGVSDLQQVAEVRAAVNVVLRRPQLGRLHHPDVRQEVLQARRVRERELFQSVLKSCFVTDNRLSLT